MKRFVKTCEHRAAVIRAIRRGIERGLGETPDDIIQKKPKDYDQRKHR